MAKQPSKEPIEDVLEQHARDVLAKHHEHIEMMAAAYFQRTNVPPDEVVLIEQRCADGTTRWWFQRRDSLPGGACAERE